MDDQTELFVVVDMDDNIIDHRTRYDCHHDKSLIHRAINIVITNQKGEILLQKRSKQKDLYPSLFGMSVGGHVNKGESYEQTALREMKEELGISIPVHFVSKEIYEAEQETEYLALFTAQSEGPFIIDESEVEYARFYSPAQILEMESQILPGVVTKLQHLKLL